MISREKLLELIELEYSCPFCGAVAGACLSYPDCPEGRKNSVNEGVKYHRVIEGDEIDPIRADSYTLTTVAHNSLREYSSDHDYFWVQKYQDDHMIDADKKKLISLWLMDMGNPPSDMTVEEVNTVIDEMLIKLNNVRIQYKT